MFVNLYTQKNDLQAPDWGSNLQPSSYKDSDGEPRC